MDDPTPPAYPDVYFTPGYGQAECLPPGYEWASINRCDDRFRVPLVLRPLGDGLMDATSPYGYSGAYADPSLRESDVQEAWTSALEELRRLSVVSVFLRHSPLVPQASIGFDHLPVVRGHSTVGVDVQDSEAAWSALESSCRNKIRKATKHGAIAEVRPAVAEDLATGSAFRQQYEGTMMRRDAAAWYHFPDEYYALLLDGLGESLLVASVRDSSGVVQSAALFLRHEHFLHYHLSGSDPAASKLGFNNLLLWSVIEHASNTGAHVLHLGGGVSPDDALFRFKASFGPKRFTYHASGLILDRGEYTRLASIHRKGGQARFFPEYRSPANV
jgi:hypothetical protein